MNKHATESGQLDATLHGKILLVDEDPQITHDLAEVLRREGLNVECVSSGSEGLKLLSEEEFDLLLADLNLPDIGGLDLLKATRQKDPSPTTILFTGLGTEASAAAALREGAFEFFLKPFVDEQMVLAIRRALEQRQMLRENVALRQQLEGQFRFHEVIGHDHRMQKIFQTCQTVAETKATVLIQGESGTGKTLIARAIHHFSPRKSGPFVEVNCGGLPETLLESELFGSVKGAYTGSVADKPGKFESANGGTIFLDEIATASPALQVKLLRVVQDRCFERVGDTKTRTCDVRIVLATNRDLAAEVKAGRFREDLFYRVNVVTVELPPLRDRISDIPLLAESFLEELAKENHRKIKGFSREALELLLAYSWPGNVRELQNAIERAVVLCRSPRIGIDDLPPHLRLQPRNTPGKLAGAVLPLKVALEGPEKQIIEAALIYFKGNRNQTATALDINRTTLFNKMRKYGLLES